MVLMGREAIEMKWKRLGGGGERGPWSKQKRMSLKQASQVRKKAVGPQKWKEVSFKGRRTKRQKMGTKEINLKRPFGSLDET